MKEQVLLIEQMQELIDMGIDTSKASMVWTYYEPPIVHEDEEGEYKLEINDWEPKKTEFPDITAFTLQDILDMLPQGFYLEKNTTSLDKKAFLQINKIVGGGYNITYEQSWDEDGKLKIKMHGQQLNESLLEASAITACL